MTSTKLFTENAKRGIKGESYVATLLSEHCILHHVTGPNDLGIDYFCEWVHDNKPTGVLFAVQVKTTIHENVDFQDEKKNNNALENWTFIYKKRGDLFKINKKTLDYWENLRIPIFLFVVIENGNELECYYKRYTDYLTRHRHNPNYDHKEDFYKLEFYRVNEGNKFLAFVQKGNGYPGGFSRDLFMDYIRINYSKGLIVHMKPEEIGLQMEKTDYKKFISEIIKNYEEKIRQVWHETEIYLTGNIE